MDPKRISRLLGTLIAVLASSMSSGIVIGLIYEDMKSVWAFAASVAVTSLVAAAFRIYGRPNINYETEKEAPAPLLPREAIVVVTFSWLFLSVLGGLPFMFDGTFVHFEDAIYESVAGFTTTGSTVLSDIEGSLSYAGQFWRCLTHWLGGMGIVVLFVAIFPQLGVGGKHLFKSEVPGPITEGLKPKIKETSAALWKVYAAMTLLNFLLLWTFGPGEDPTGATTFARDGMDWFHSLCHAFSTMGTGGFSTRNGSIGDYHSVSVDIITITFMFLAGVNFSLYYLAFFKGSIRNALRDRELWFYSGVALLSILAIAVSLMINADVLALRENHPAGIDYNEPLSALRYSAMQVLAVMTTTGFGTDNFDDWSPFSRLLLVFLMFMGGSAGSTSGGIKVFRVLVILKAIRMEVVRTFRPNVVQALRVGEGVIPSQTVHSITVFLGLFLLVFVFGTLYIAAFGYDIVTSATAVVSCLASIGPGLGLVNGASNFGFFEPSIKIMLSFCMVLGRLELFTLLVLLAPSFWRR